MATIRRVRSVVTGVPGTPWYTNTYHSFVGGAGQGCVDAVRDWWTAWAASMDNNNSVLVEGDTALLDDVTGNITGIDSVLPRTVALTGATQALPQANQLVMNLFTSTFIGGRQLRGRIFIPGMLSSAADTQGLVTGAIRTAVVTHGTALITNTSGPGPLRIWSRKNGTSSVVNAVSSPTIFGVLRSRRD